jgi:dTDP-glucose 4,6-dehydratase
MKTILVTGGAGFIGSNFVHLVRAQRPDWKIVVLDKLTYSGRKENLADVLCDGQVQFVKGDICNAKAVEKAMQDCAMVFNFAAETHVDRSLLENQPGVFVQTNVYGVFTLLETAKKQGVERFVQVSTDEVYGEVNEGFSVETDALAPRSPYSAAKAGGELLAQSYYQSHGVPVIITRGSNTFGTHQFPEKLIPLFISNALDDKPLPLYGDGLQQRDWIYAEDHASGILKAAEDGKPGESYNVGGGNQQTNRVITSQILQLLDKPDSLIKMVTDRPGHDRRYALDCSKIQALGWQPKYAFEDALKLTVDWYLANQTWWRVIKESKSFADYYQKNYSGR